jgi:membrane-bound serine protease (ClpP class)
VTAVGIALLLLGATLVVVETHVPSLGFLGVPGAAGLVAGAALVVGGLGGGVGVVVVVSLVFALASLPVLGSIMRKGNAARRRRVRTGAEGLVGGLGVVRSWGEGDGRVLLEGALWRARRAWPELDDKRLGEGDVVVVEAISGLTLAVRGAEDWERER